MKIPIFKTIIFALFVYLTCLQFSTAAPETWASTGAMNTPRYDHTETLLANGKVLITGGEGSSVFASAELYDPATGIWSNTGAMSVSRIGHTATLLADGKVLVAGGYNGTIHSRAELYDPTTGTWTNTGSMNSLRTGHTATLLANGKVLVAGGEGGFTNIRSDAELYDPVSGSWTLTGSMSNSRWIHGATLLENGKVLVTGGRQAYNNGELSSATLYDPATGIWTNAGTMSSSRIAHTATLLADGKVLVTGGYNGSVYLSSVDLYDPTNGIWSNRNPMSNTRGNHTATLLANGRVLVAGGGLSSTDLYNPATDAWANTGAMSNSRAVHSATLLSNSRVLVAGGSNVSGVLSSAEIYELYSTFTITIAASEQGTITGDSSPYLVNTNAILYATPNPGYIFDSWSGDAAGSGNPLTLLMEANKIIGANFVADSRDLDNDGLTNYQEAVTYLSNPNLSDTDGDGINDGAEVQQGRSPKVAEAVITNFIATQRTGTKFFDISYDIASTTTTVKISMEISSDGGTTYTVPTTSATGAIGEGVSAGTGKSIVWNAGIDWDAKSSAKMRFRLIADNQIIDGLSLIPAGAFTMGRTSGDTDSNAPPVTVTLSRFYMGKNEVTKALWDDVRTWALTNGYTDLAAGAGKAADHPVQLVSWWDVIKWCNARSQKEGLTPVYTVSGAVMKTGTTAPTVNWSANGYRLPTEAEWEKAARGGLSGKRFPWGIDTISHLNANFENVSLPYHTGTQGYHPTYATGAFPYTSPVGSFAANDFGLHDVSGNVWEWCWDWSDDNGYISGATDPRGATNGIGRIMRGGSWINLPYSGSLGTRCVARGSIMPNTQTSDIGLRIARSSGIGALASLASNNTNLDTRMWTLTSSTVVNGSLTGAGSYLSQTNANLTATPSSGYIFGSWNGAASGSTNPLTILLDSDKTVGATFVEDTRDPDSDGLTNYQEIVIHGSNQDLADTDGDGITDGTEVAQGRSPKTVEPVVTNLIATQRQGSKYVDITYDLASLTPTVKVALEISSDGGLTYNVPVTSTTGAIGNGVTVGTGKTIAWNAGVDWDGNFSNQMRFRLVADDLQVPGFSLIPAGAFTMGRTSGDTDTNAPPVNVTVSQFYMGKYEVTKAEWDEVRAWAVNNGYTDLLTGAGKASNHPVHSINWFDMVKWCNARSQKEGLTPCYTVSGSVMKTGTTAPTVNWTANGYRLPTEAEWEKAARGGVSGKRFPWGTDTISHSEANFKNSGSETYKSGATGYHPTYATGSTPYTSPVGSFSANGFGLHDMAGNVFEWCWDWYGAPYANNSTDPRGAASGTNRVSRGGGWDNGLAFACRAADRGNGVTPSFSFNGGGFRVARSNSLTLGVSNSSSVQNTTVDIRNFSLSKTTTTNGSISGNGFYLSGSSAAVTATPHPGYLFGSWTGNASGSANPTTVWMDANKAVGATFVEDSRDPDSDGLTNYQEIIVRLTNPDISDTDSDGVNDGQEVTDATNPLVVDTDADGLSDGNEKTRGTNPLLSDTDGDGYSDSYEVQFFTDPKLATSVPKFLLTLSNNGSALGGSFAMSGSLAHGTNASVTATPLPGYLLGSWTGNASGSTNPTTVLMNSNKIVGANFVEDTRDPDNDGLTNYQEIIVRLTNPIVSDSDNDGVNDGQEVTDTTNPLIADTDGDGLSDSEEKSRSTNPLVTDTDGDSYSDSYEVNNDADPTKETSFPTYTLTLTNNGTATGGTFAKSGTLAHGTNATVTATPLSGYLFGSWNGASSGSNNPTTVLMNSNKTVGANFVEDTRDPDNDGLTNYQEIIIRLTNPNLSDSDNDGVKDGQEVTDTTNPLIADTDGDGLSDGEEKTRSTNPLVTDTDGDSYSDSYEVNNDADPTKETSFPTYTLTLTNNGTATGGTFAKSGTLAHGTNATVTATPLSGYLFGSWNGASSGSNNPTTVLMDSDKTVGATFVNDPRDPDNDGLTNYQEIIIRLTNPDLADSDSDGVNDGQEVTDTTNPLIADTDGDGLSDGEEKSRSTNPLVTDTDGDSYSDSYEVNNDADPTKETSFPTYTLTLTNNGTATGGTFAKTGTLAHGTNATVTATPLSGYLFGSWNGASSGSNNPTTVLMNSNKTVGANFVEDNRDPDNDGLTNYQEIIVRLTNPNVGDSDNDGVNDGQEVTDATNPLVADSDGDGLNDGEEKSRTTNPLVVDTDGDGLGDLQEITISQTNPLLSDTNGNGINDALEDADNDGILNGREINQLGTNPLLADSNANGLSDTYELLFQGNTDPFTPRVGDRVRYDLSQLGYQGIYKVVGTLPNGLTFNATTGILEGKLIGTAGTSKLTIQILNGKTVLRSIPLNIPVLAFPATLVGTWQTLLENQQDQPEGLLTVTITSPGTWSASYDGIGTRTLRKAKGSFDLTAAEEEASWSMTFPASSTLQSGLPAVTMSFEIVGKSALAEGTHPRGTMRGFRLARGAELPAKTNTITMLIDQGAQDGFVIPAGMGWATGSISNRGAVSLKGQLGDAQAITASLSLGATGQALMWLKPYKNLNSFIGGIVSLHGSGVLPASPLHNQESELWWYRAADAAELGYSTGFAPISPFVGVRSHLLPTSALALSQNLGLTEQVIRGVAFDGGGLPDPNAVAKLPEAFAIDASYKMIAVPIPGQPMTPWTGLIASRTGGFTGTLKVVASNSDTIAGNAAVSGVLFPTVGSRVVGAGLVKIPIVGPKGAFRTGAILLGTEEQN